jgi:hypothetical protein
MDNSQWTTLLTNYVSNLGFSIVLAAYLLIRFEKKIEVLNNSIQELTRIIRDGGKNNE